MDQWRKKYRQPYYWLDYLEKSECISRRCVSKPNQSTIVAIPPYQVAVLQRHRALTFYVRFIALFRHTLYETNLILFEDRNFTTVLDGSFYVIAEMYQNCQVNLWISQILSVSKVLWTNKFHSKFIVWIRISPNIFSIFVIVWILNNPGVKKTSWRNLKIKIRQFFSLNSLFCMKLSRMLTISSRKECLH